MSTHEQDRGPLVTPPLWWVCCAMLAVVVRLLSTGTPENGDGVQHYQIARYAWDHPELLLHHWGKPLFTLFAAPFAQLGHWGMTLFNALCFVVTCWAADGMLRKAAGLARWLFPPALLVVPVYGSMLLGGMTEVFFAMLAMLVVRALFDGHYRWAMVVVSFMPFARPEYIGFAPFAIAWVLRARQWKALPFLLVGHVIYGVIGDIVLGDPLWAFHRDPYTGAENIYGRGELLHFTNGLPQAFGVLLLWATCLGLLAAGALFAWRRSERAMLSFLLVLALLPALAVLSIHSVLWWKGAMGSLGLLRVLATVAPLVVLWAVWTLVRGGSLLLPWPRARTVVGATVGFVFVVLGAFVFLHEHPLPVRPDRYERFVQDVGVRVGSLRSSYQRVVYFHPYIAYAAGFDPYDTRSALNGVDHSRPDLGLRDGDLLVWDAHFGPNEGGLPLDRALGDSDLSLLEVMAPQERMEVLGGSPFEVFLFTRGRTQDDRNTEILLAQGGVASAIPHSVDTAACVPLSPGAWCFTNVEFPFGMGPIPLERPNLLYTEVLVSGQIEWLSGTTGHLELVFEEENGTERMSYWSQKLEGGPFQVWYRIPRRESQVRNKLYLWDPQRTAFRLTGLKVEATHIQRSGS